MSVKVLMRTHKTPVVTSTPSLFESRWDAFKSWLPSLRNDGEPLTFGRRKTADGLPPSMASNIKEFFALNFPSLIDPAAIANMASKVKLPLGIAVGVAAVAGLAYAVYKLWTGQWKLPEAVKSILDDLKAAAPDLTKLPGWFDSIKAEVNDAFKSDNPATIVERLTKIRDAVMGHQKSINPSGSGGGIDFFYDLGLRHHGINPPGGRLKPYGAGRGVKIPM